jgi:hypothetical protein
MASLGANVAVHGTTPFSTRAFSEADSLEAVANAIAAEQGVGVLPVHGDLPDESTVKTVANGCRREQCRRKHWIPRDLQGIAERRRES